MLIRGEINEKLELCFYIFDKDQKGFLAREELMNLVDTLIKSLIVMFDMDLIAQFREQSVNFKKRLREKYNLSDKISLPDLLTIQSDPYMLDVASFYTSLQRSNTSVFLSEELEKLSQNK